MNLIYKIKKVKYRKLALFIMVIAVFGCEMDETQTVVTRTELVIADEFDTDGAPNSGLWSNWIGTAFNNELQYYTNRPENIKVENGMLHITALKESFQGSGYTSARIETKGLFEQKYGRFEARIKLPWGKGIWPAFWLLGANIENETDNDPNTLLWPFCGEIDVMEHRGQEPTLINGSIHGPGYAAVQAVTKPYDLIDDRFDTGFHIFGIEWGPQYINFYVDDVLYNQITPNDLTDYPEPDPIPLQFADEENPESWKPEYKGMWNKWVFDNQPFYIIINLAVGGDYVGSPNDDTVFPQTMLVDYVRVYK